MNAVLRNEHRLMPMTVADLHAVSSIEAAAYDFPWTRGNFIDSLAAGYLARVLRDVGSSRVDLQACKLEYSIVSPK